MPTLGLALPCTNLARTMHTSVTRQTEWAPVAKGNEGSRPGRPDKSLYAMPPIVRRWNKRKSPCRAPTGPQPDDPPPPEQVCSPRPGESPATPRPFSRRGGLPGRSRPQRHRPGSQAPALASPARAPGATPLCPVSPADAPHHFGPRPAARAHRPQSHHHSLQPRLGCPPAPPSPAARGDDVDTTHWSTLQGPADWSSLPAAPPQPCRAAPLAGRPTSLVWREDSQDAGLDPYGAAAGRADATTGVGARVQAAAPAAARPGTSCSGRGEL